MGDDNRTPVFGPAGTQTDTSAAGVEPKRTPAVRPNDASDTTEQNGASPSPRPPVLHPASPPPPPLSDGEPPYAEPQQLSGTDSAVDFAEQIVKSGRHPVLLFGTAESGKSTFLISLINSLAQNQRGINITLGDRIFSRSDEDAERYHQRAIEFYERYSRRFAEGTQLPSTIADKPFFIPVDVTPPQGPPIRLAFLEGSGEWIKPIGADSGALFQDLRPEIVNLLQHFGAGTSMIYIAPYSIGDGNEGSTRESDTGLNGAIIKYQGARNLPQRDSHLFVLAKWDTFAKPINDDAKFSDVEEEDVAEILQERFPQSWSCFRNLPIKPNSGRRFFMQYASGNIVGGIVRQPPPKHRDTFDRYPRTVWNWIYTNAVAAQQEAGKRDTEPAYPLFPEVLAVAPPRVPMVARIIAILTRG